MATNGNGTWKTIAVGLAIALSGVVGFAANELKSSVDSAQAHDSIRASISALRDDASTHLDDVKKRVDTNELNIALQTLQLAEIAKAVKAPVIMDTATATRTVAKDSIP